MICDLLPALVASGARLAAYNTPEYLRDVGTPARHATGRARSCRQPGESDLNSRHPAARDILRLRRCAQRGTRSYRAPCPRRCAAHSGAGAAVATRARSRPADRCAVTNRPQVAKGFVTFEGSRRFWAGSKRCLRRMAACSTASTSARIIRRPGSRRNSRAEDPLRMPKAGHAAVATRLRRPADRPTAIGTDRRQPRATSARRANSASGPTASAPDRVAAIGERTAAKMASPPIPDLMFENVSEAVDFDLNIPGDLRRSVVCHQRRLEGQTSSRWWSAFAGARARESRTVATQSFGR